MAVLSLSFQNSTSKAKLSVELTSEYLMSSNGLELLNKMFYSAGEGIIIVNESGKIALANKRSEDIFHYESGELLGKSIENLVPKKVRTNHRKLRDGFVANPSARPMGEGRDLEGVTKDGLTFPLEISLSYIEHDDSKFVVAFINDITTRKRQEQALKESRTKLQNHARDLESKVKERTRELEHLNMGLKSQIRERKLAENALKNSLEDLQKAEKEILKSLEYEKELNELKSRFVSMASHEFRTPLTTILSSANLIGKYTLEDQQKSREKHVKRIKNSVHNLTSILNDFLSLEKLESGALQLNKSQFDLHELLDEVVEAIKLTLKKDQRINVDISEGLTEVTTDSHILRNVLYNLLSNASKYSDPGKNIELTVRLAGSRISMTVKDEGIGIPKDEQKKLFGRFFRANNATNIQGTGLGLNIVKRYMDLMNGTIDFHSKQGVGSEFIITFPIS